MVQNITQFIHTTPRIPPEAQHWAKLALLDLIGTAACAAATTDMSRIIRNHAATLFPGGNKSAQILFDGRTASPPAAAMAGACTIDAIDAHDGQKLTKGHIGCAVLPSLLAMLQAENKKITGDEFLTLLTIGYEIGSRAGQALHRTVADYHASGSWAALAATAAACRVMNLSPPQTMEALGIAEYHGPRSQMMRCIDYPTMVKDSSALGAFIGCQAAYLAAEGFSGAPAVTMTADEVADIWQDLGARWYMCEQYFKLYPVCRWAQPAVAACRKLSAAHDFVASDIERLHIVTFHEAKRLAVHRPRTTEQAQYSLPYPVAAFLVRGVLTAAEVTGMSLCDEEILSLSDRIEVVEGERYNAIFPARRAAEVTIFLRGGGEVSSGFTEAEGDPEVPLSEVAIREKFRVMCGDFLDDGRLREIEDMCCGLEGLDDLGELFGLVMGEIRAFS